MLKIFLRLNYQKTLFLLYFFTLFSMLGCTPPSGLDPGPIQVTVNGLNGTLVLQNNGGDNLTITSNGEHQFSTTLAYGASYSVTVLTQPNGQTCTVIGGTGLTTTQNLVRVTCTDNPQYTVGGTVTGLTGIGATLVLQNNGGNDLSLTIDGSFTFSTALANGATYLVTILTQPLPGNCVIASGASGTISNANVTNVTVTCTP